MELRRRRRAPRGIELTPLIDVVFLLLVFLILTANFQPAVLELELPGGATEEAGQEPAVLLELAADGTLALDGAAVTASALDGALRAALVPLASRAVRLRADERVPFGRLLPVIEAARASGARTFDLEHAGGRP